MSLDRRHKAALIREYGKPLVIEEIPTPKPQGNQVLIRVLAAGICHTDVHVWRGDWATIGIPPKLPFIISHEIVGEIVARGENVPDTWREGRKVLVYAWQWSGEDEFIARGLTQLSDNPRHLAIHIDGGLQEYFLVEHYRFLVDVEGIDDVVATAPLACAGLTTFRATRRILPYLDIDDYVAVIGLGGLGLYAIQWLKALTPYVNIIGIDIREEPISYALRITKIDHVVNASREDPIKTIMDLTRGRGVKAVIDLVGTDKTIGIYLHSVAKTGLYMIVGMMGLEAKISPILPLIVNEKIIVTTIVGTLYDQIQVVKAARRKLINYSDVISKRLKLEEATIALEELEKGKAIGRQIIVF